MRFGLVWWSLTKGVLLESIRRKDIWVVVLLGALTIFSAGAIGFFGFSGLEMFAKDLGLTVLGLFSTILAVLVASRQIPDELKNRTLYPLLARPIRRFDFLFGKFLGSVLVSWLSFLLLAFMVSVALLVFGVAFEAILLQYALLKMMGLAIVCAVSMMLSINMTQSGATTLSLILVFGASMMTRGLTMAALGTPSMAWLYSSVSALLPQIGLYDISSRVVNEKWPTVPAWAVGGLTTYLCIYVSAMLLISWSKFKKQAI